jgi:catechol 2,3-dioxygenase
MIAGRGAEGVRAPRLMDDRTGFNRSLAGLPPPAFRLPDSTCVGRVRLQVADLERSLGFYGDLLGFHVIERLGPWGGKRVLLGPRDDSVLLELHEKRGARPVPRRGLLGLYHFAVLLPSRDALGALLMRLDGAGVRPGMADHHYSQSLYLNDPDGLGVEVYADQPRDRWIVRQGEIVGRVDPLDVEELVALGEPYVWSGLPAGTRIGHVHLFVGDLDAASRFYHEGLGLDKVGWSFPGALFLSAGGYHHHVGVNTWASGASPAGDEDAKLLEWELLTSDPREAADSLRQRGYAVDEADGAWRARDPWGTVVRLP